MLWLKVIAMFVVVPGIADAFVPWLILTAFGKLTFTRFGFFQIAGVVLVALGLAVVVWVCQAFVRRGKGTPAPFDPPRQFVSEGLYRWVRNPMYLGAAILIPLGEAAFFQTFWLVLYSALIVIFIHLYIVYFEEPALVKRFGRPYKKYLRVVPRWIPHIPKD